MIGDDRRVPTADGLPTKKFKTKTRVSFMNKVDAPLPWSVGP